MYEMQSFSRQLDAFDNKNMTLKTSHSLSFHDREEIRRRLAMDSETEDMLFGSNKMSRKSSLASRLQNGQSLQICFMNESANDNISDDQSDCDGLNAQTGNGDAVDNSNVYNHKYDVETSPNNNSCLDITNSFAKTILNNRLSETQLESKRPSHLFTKLTYGSQPLDSLNMFSSIPKPTEKEKFQDYYFRLHTEAKFALSQVKEIVKRQIEVELQFKKIKSPIYNLIDIPFKYQFKKHKLSKKILQNMSLSLLQLIVNDLYSQVEKLNEELVQHLLERDERHMEQDSLLVDIEDLTIFLFSKHD